jgi:hypothetical protein
MSSTTKTLALVVLTGCLSVAGYHAILDTFLRDVRAQEGPKWMEGLKQQHNSVWTVHDIRRPKPVKVDAGKTSSDAPSDAIVLFDGSNLDEWEPTRKELWAIEDGAMQVNNKGNIRTKRAFGDCQLHLEYMAPAKPQKKSQGRGNSGIIFMGKYEVQVVDNWENPTYPDGYIGSVYGQHPPMVNPCRRPGVWQSYDIVFKAPRFDGKKLVSPGHFTVFLNGVLVQHNSEIYGGVAWRRLAKYTSHGPTGKLVLQDHGDRQTPRFRNIWIRELDLSHEALDQREAFAKLFPKAKD